MPRFNDVLAAEPIVFSDLRAREEATRRQLKERLLLLKSIPRKRQLTPDEEVEQREIEAKLATDDVVDPLYRAVHDGLGLDVGDHKDGLLPSQLLRLVKRQDTKSGNAASTIPSGESVLQLAGFDPQDKVSGDLEKSFQSLWNNAKDSLPVLKDIASSFDEFAADLADGQKQAQATKDLAAAIEKATDGFKPFGKALARAVRENKITEAEKLVDILAGLISAPVPPQEPEQLTEDEKLVAAVYGLMEIEGLQPPAFHLRNVKARWDPDEAGRRQKFGKALFAAQGEYQTNRDLFSSVLPILAAEGEGGQNATVSNEEWARVVRKLIARRVDAEEPQLSRRVNDALDSIQNVGDDLPPSDIGIDLPDLEEETDAIESERILDLQPAYFAAMFEELKIFQVVEKLVDLFHAGILPIGRGDAGNLLFKYWKEAALRVSEAERRSFYARTLGFPGGDDAGMPNREFQDLWMRFVSPVSSFVRQHTLDDLLRTKVPGAISQQQVRKAARDLAANLSLHGYGIAHFMATELQKQVKDVIQLLSDADIKNAYGARDMWQVIDQVATLELGGAKNSVKYRTMAASGAIIIAWLAKKAPELRNISFGPILDVDEIRNPSPRRSGTKPTNDPSDFDLVNACEQWLAVTGTQEDAVETYAQPRETPQMTSKPIQIPAIAREMLDSVGVPMSVGARAGGNGYGSGYGRR
jgi:hypothetical protein